MGEMSDGPMAGQGQGDPDGYAPKHPRQPAQGIEEQGKGELLGHPDRLQPAQDRIAGNLGFDGETWGVVQVKAAMHLPPGVAPEARPMRGMGWAGGLALMPVAHVMGADHAKGARHAHQCAQIDEQAFQPQGGIETAVNEQPVHPHRVARADGDGGQDGHHGGGVPGGEQGDGGDGPGGVGEPPQRFGGVPDDAAFQHGVRQGSDAVGCQKDHLAPAGVRGYNFIG